MRAWTTLERRTILAHSRYLTVEEHTVRLPDGRVIPDWPWLVTPDYVNIAAVTPDGRWLCFRQVKYAVGGESWSLPGGFLEPFDSRKIDLEGGSLARTADTRDSPMVVLHNPVNHGETQAGAFPDFLGGEERVKNMFQR